VAEGSSAVSEMQIWPCTADAQQMQAMRSRSRLFPALGAVSTMKAKIKGREYNDSSLHAVRKQAASDKEQGTSLLEMGGAISQTQSEQVSEL